MAGSLGAARGDGDMTVLVLDCDGVVISGHAEGGRWDRHVLRDLGLKPELLQARFFQPHWRHIEIGRADLFEVLERIWPELECAAAPRDVVRYWFDNDATKNADVLAAVDAWRAAGRPAFLGTTQEHHRARHLWEVLGLKNHFDGMLYSAQLGARKPDADYFARAQARLPVAAPGEVVFLDDTAANVEAARAHGWRAFHFKAAADLRAALRASGSGTD